MATGRVRWRALPAVLVLLVAVAPATAAPAAAPAAAPPVLAAPTPEPRPAASSPPASPGPRRQPTYADAISRSLVVGVTRGAVVDLRSGRTVWQDGAAEPAIPASTTKLLTASAALSALGPEHTFTTSLVHAGGPGGFVLVGGGDPLLSAGSGRLETGVEVTPIDRLSRRAATAIRALPSARRPHHVVIRFDDSLFGRPTAPPTWLPAYVASGAAGPVGALSLDAARVRPHSNRRVPDPGAHAAAVLASRLTALGLPARAGPRVHAPHSARRVAAVTSVPLADVVEHTLTESDNDSAEVLARQVAVAAGVPATAGGAAAAVRRAVSRLGVDLTGARILDGSGLSRGTRLTPRQLVDVVALAADPEHPELGSVLSGMAVAGLTGTLAGRYPKPVYAAGRGVVRAKTGGLRGVSGLVGTTVGADGRTYAFGFLTNDVHGSLNPARHALDAAAVAVTRCGCR